ncbi:MAG: ABC transporter ATP-binding protein, partial [Flavobacteriia bacterium]|nr:ABC transporter ATP-binding protein [Flavobacteriia bacterium]
MKALWTLNPYFWRYKWLLLSGVLFVLLSSAFSVFPAVYIRQAFDEVALAISGRGSPDAQRSLDLKQALILYSALILGLSIIKGLFTFLMRQTLIVMSRHIEYDLKNAIYAHYQQLDLAFYRRNSTGDLMNRISEDVSRTRMYIGPALMYTLNTAFATGITLYFMFSVDVRLSLLTLAPMPILVWCIYRVSTLINQRSHAVQAQQSAISTLAQETFSGLRVLKAFGLEEEQTERYAESAARSFQQNERLYRVNALFMPLMLLLVGASTLIAVWVGGQGVIEGRLSPGVIAEFIYYVNLLTWPIASIGWVMSMVQRAEASMQRINDFLHVEPAIQNAPGARSPETIRGEIVFENVSYTYPDSGIQALKNFSARIAPGETIVVV